MSSFVYGHYRHLAKPARRRRRLSFAPVVGAVAAAAGHVLRGVRRVALAVPGVAGAGLVAFGAWLAWPPVGFVVAGVFLLLLDRRAP